MSEFSHLANKRHPLGKDYKAQAGAPEKRKAIAKKMKIHSVHKGEKKSDMFGDKKGDY